VQLNGLNGLVFPRSTRLISSYPDYTSRQLICQSICKSKRRTLAYYGHQERANERADPAVALTCSPQYALILFTSQVSLINLNGNNDQVCNGRTLVWTHSNSFSRKRGDDARHLMHPRGASRLSWTLTSASPWIKLGAIAMQVDVMHECMRRDSSWLDNAAGKSHRDPRCYRFPISVIRAACTISYNFFPSSSRWSFEINPAASWRSL